MITTALFEESLTALKVNRLRTALTMLGMIIGVGAVIAMLAVGNGARDAVNNVIRSMGSNLLIVLSGAPSSRGLRFASGTSPTLTLQDAQSIRQIDGVSAVAPGTGGAVQVVYGSNNWNTSVLGTSQQYLQIRDWPLSSGINFSNSDIRTSARVALLGQTVARNLFGGVNPVGKVIRISRSPYLVIGLLSAKGQSFGGQDQDDTVIIPVTTALHKLFGSQFVDTVRFIMVQTRSPDLLNPVMTQIIELLRQRHHIPKGREDDFTVRNMTEIANAYASTTRIMSLLLGVIASISLIVGGIGIMNIMLVSVTERTREIGIRMAVGAKPRDILQQFLTEAILVSVGGSIIGIIAGAVVVLVAKGVLDLNSVITPISIIIAFMVSVGVGVFFGFYPARKAARLEPIEALRYQ